jgi:hypothetical protein
VTRRNQPSLFPPTSPAGGPVYQGVSAQFRTMFPKGDEDAERRKAELTGWVRLALDHARALDASPLVSVGRAQCSAELRETLTYIAEAASTGDGFDRFLEELTRDTSTAPHPEV